MKFTGKNLDLVRQGLEMAISDCRNEIAICPDVYAYAEAIDDLEDQIEDFERLIARIDRAEGKAK